MTVTALRIAVPLFSRHLLLLALLLWAGAAVSASPINTSLFGGTAVKGYDVVAYQTQNKAVEGSKDYVHEWMDAKWRFASQENLELFKADPERYAPQYGGYCAFGAAKGYLVGIDPEAFSVVGDKLYLNYSKEVQTEWEADRDGFIQKADRNWPELTK